MPFKESTERQGARPFLQFDLDIQEKSTGASVDHRLAIPLLIATLILFSARSRADEPQESLRAAAGGPSVAVAVPARTGS